MSPRSLPTLLFLAPRLLRSQSTSAALVSHEPTPSDVSTSGRLRKKVRSMPDDPLTAVPPRTRGPPAIEDTWTMRLGDSTWYAILGVMAGCTLWMVYEAQAGYRHRRRVGKKFLDQFRPEERAAQFNNPQSPFSEASLGTPNEQYPFIIESTPRKPGEMPREPSMLEKMLAADSTQSRKKLVAKREKIAADAQAKLEAAQATDGVQERGPAS